MSGSIPPNMLRSIETALRLKSRMIETHLQQIGEECPRCGHRVTAWLVPPKQHLRLSCETPVACR